MNTIANRPQTYTLSQPQAKNTANRTNSLLHQTNTDTYTVNRFGQSRSRVSKLLSIPLWLGLLGAGNQLLSGCAQNPPGSVTTRSDQGGKVEVFDGANEIFGNFPIIHSKTAEIDITTQTGLKDIVRKTFSDGSTAFLDFRYDFQVLPESAAEQYYERVGASNPDPKSEAGGDSTVAFDNTNADTQISNENTLMLFHYASPIMRRIIEEEISSYTPEELLDAALKQEVSKNIFEKVNQVLEPGGYKVHNFNFTFE
jgi:hypothetical protein